MHKAGLFDLSEIIGWSALACERGYVFEGVRSWP